LAEPSFSAGSTGVTSIRNLNEIIERLDGDAGASSY
jgi:hypothetical protein